MVNNFLYEYFTKQLIDWNSTSNNRIMPWKGETDPYKIWLSEVILQQTRVEQGLEFYKKFIQNFPTITHLAKAPDTKVYKLWEGLGYYTRCKNLITTAQFISKEKKGVFPDTYREILALKGVGPYTAAAIASFAYNLPHAVVDGNVYRVLARFFGIHIPIDSALGKKTFTTLANEILDKKQPAIYNQAIMDFGATVCKPQKPLCNTCSLRLKCVAHREGLIQILPIKEKNISKTTRYFFYYIATCSGKVYVRKREESDIWKGLYDFILVEKTMRLAVDSLSAGYNLFAEAWNMHDFTVIKISKKYKQQLTHQTIEAQFIYIKLDKPLKSSKYQLIDIKKVKKLPFPKLINAYFDDNNHI